MLKKEDWFISMTETKSNYCIPNISETVRTGTGFTINKDGYTPNYHVVEEQKSIKVYIEDKPYLSKVIVNDKENDLTILKINKSFSNIPYTFKDKKLGVAEEVLIMVFH